MEQKQYPITGTFIDEITYDIPSSNWTNEQWAQDLDYMKEVGIDTLIVMRSVFYDKCIYPSKIFSTLKKQDEDFAGFILEEAAKRGMQVFMGMYISNLTWNDGDYQFEVEQNKKFLKEFLGRYKDMPAFKGWYIPQEGGSRAYNLKETMGAIAKLCKEVTPDKPVLISPFFRGRNHAPNDYFTPKYTEKLWMEILSEGGQYIDYCAFQDGTVPLDEYDEYLAAIKRVCDYYDIKLWANVETFERDVRQMYFPIPFDVLRRKIEIAEKHVEKCITFEFSHFLSPQSIFPSAKNLNTLYRNYYEKKK